MSVRVGFFPLDEVLYLGEHRWTPETIKQIVRHGTEIASYRRAAECFEGASQMGVSKSSVTRLVNEYGQKVVADEQAEAEAMVKAPSRDEAIIPREMPEPESEVMAVSADGVMVHLIEEGWKEVKIATISAVESQPKGGQAEEAVHLSQHSYRAGIWEAKEFAKHQWAEGCRRGLERAKTIVSINDGAVWIWAMIQMCWAPCVEILDWWHAVEKLWEIGRSLFDPNSPTMTAWVQRQKDSLWHGHLRHIFRAIRQACPRGQPLPEKVRQNLFYFFKNRRRVQYPLFRQAALPVGSGSVESACKLLVQARMKQAGMRWRRQNAQALLALRASLLSDRWDELWDRFRPPPKLA